MCMDMTSTVLQDYEISPNKGMLDLYRITIFVDTDVFPVYKG